MDLDWAPVLSPTDQTNVDNSVTELWLVKGDPGAN